MTPGRLLRMAGAAAVLVYVGVFAVWVTPYGTAGDSIIRTSAMIFASLPGAVAGLVFAAAGVRALQKGGHRASRTDAAAVWWLLALSAALLLVLAAPADFRPDGIGRLELAAWTLGQLSLAAALPVWLPGSAPYVTAVALAAFGPAWAGRAPWVLVPTALLAGLVIALGGIILVTAAMLA